MAEEKKRKSSPPARRRGRRKRNKYIEYDYAKIHDCQIDGWDEWMIEQLLAHRKLSGIYATKEIYAGDQLEIELYPEYTRAQAKEQGIRQIDKNKQREAQKDLNNRNSRKRLWRIAEHNFDDGDLWMTLTHDEDHLPKDMEEAKKCIQRFITNINGKRKRRGLPLAKYIYVTEVVSNDGETVRVHHHLIMDALLDIDTVEKTWKYGRRNECRRLKKDENGIVGASEYMAKPHCDQGHKKYAKTWNKSRNLEEPPEKKHHQTRKTAIRKMVKNHDYVQEYVQESTRYKGYLYTKHEVFYNEHNGGWYIRVRMRKGDRDGKKESDTAGLDAGINNWKTWPAD